MAAITAKVAFRSRTRTSSVTSWSLIALPLAKGWNRQFNDGMTEEIVHFRIAAKLPYCRLCVNTDLLLSCFTHSGVLVIQKGASG